MNRYHALATQNELHRPERSGTGNPNALDLQQVLDGQYYQDSLTGSVYRYYVPTGETNVANGQWELLISYDRLSGSIGNIGTLPTSRIGVTFAEIGVAQNEEIEGIERTSVSYIPAYLYTQVRAGEEITVVSRSDSSVSATFTALETVNAGRVGIPVQGDVIDFLLPAGSSINLDDALFASYQSVDPTKIESALIDIRRNDAIGVVSGDLTITSNAEITQIPVEDILSTTVLDDDQEFTMFSSIGFPIKLIANGRQTLQPSTGVINVDPYDPIVSSFDAGTVIEKSIIDRFDFEGNYIGKGYRLLLEQRPLNNPDAANKIKSAFASGAEIQFVCIKPSGERFVFTGDLFGFFLLFTLNESDYDEIPVGSNIYFGPSAAYRAGRAYIKEPGYASTSRLTQAIDVAGNALSSATTISNILLTNGISGSSNITNRVSIVEGEVNTTAEAVTSIENTLNLNNITATSNIVSRVTGVEGDIDSIEAEVVLKTDVNGNIALFELGSTSNGSAININADQIEINNIVFDKDNGTIGSSNYDGTPGLQAGWLIEGNGDAYFNNVNIRGVGTEFIYNVYEGSVMRTSETALDGTANSAGILITENGFYAAGANQNTSNANVRILSDGSAFFTGTVTATSGSFTGSITATSGSLYDLTVSGTLTLESTGEIYYNTGVGDGEGIVKLDTAGITLYANDLDTIGIQFGNDTSGTTAIIKPTLSGHIQVSGNIETSGNIRATVGNIRGNFQSSDGTQGINTTETWFDSAATLTHTVVVKDGLITSWTTS